MASVCNLKRSRVDDCSQDNRQTKRHKSAPGHRAAIFPPSFWDDLSKVWLTTRALRELDRRNKHRPATPEASGRFATKDLARFARQGGPDLRRLRGVSPSFCLVAKCCLTLQVSRTERACRHGFHTIYVFPRWTDAIDQGNYPWHPRRQVIRVQQ